MESNMDSNDEILLNMLRKQEKILAEKNAEITSAWSIENKEIFQSKVSQCYEVIFGAKSIVLDDSGENVVFGSCHVCMPLGNHVPLLMEYMDNNKILDEITAKGIFSTEDNNIGIRIIKFQNCKIASCKKLDTSLDFCFTYREINSIFNVCDKDTGNPVGKEISFDSRSLKTKKIA